MSTPRPLLLSAPRPQPVDPGLRGPQGRVRRGATARRRAPLQACRPAPSAHEASVAAMGVVAAGCAHDLAAPLSSMRLLVDEMQQGAVHPVLPAQWQANLNLLDQQLQVSIGVLRRLMGLGQQPGDALLPAQPLALFLAQAAARQQVLHPRTKVTADTAGLSGAPVAWADERLRQAVGVLLNNAAQAARSRVQVSGTLAGPDVVISVVDDGPGYPEHALPRLGHARFSTKPAAFGSGLGLVLVRLTAQHLGGEVRFSNPERGGAQARLRLPLAQAAPNGTR